MLACGGFWLFTAFRFRNWCQRIHRQQVVMAQRRQRASKEFLSFLAFGRGA
jgi:hypothetical protein